MKLKTLLGQIYEPFGNEWVKQNGFVFDKARQTGATLAGSIALAVGRKKAVRPPGDLDFVCQSIQEARNFIHALEDFLFKRSIYWKVQINSKTAFCPDGCSVHFRFTAPFWLPICVMVIPEVRFWRVDGGNQIQQFDDVVRAAKALDDRDGKGRINVDEFDDIQFPDPPEEPYEEPRDKFGIQMESHLDEQDHTYSPRK